MCLRDNLWKGLEDALVATLGPHVASQLDYGLWQGIHSTLFYYLGFVLVGDRRRAAAFSPLVRLLPDAVVLGKRTGERENWVFLTG